MYKETYSVKVLTTPQQNHGNSRLPINIIDGYWFYTNRFFFKNKTIWSYC